MNPLLNRRAESVQQISSCCLKGLFRMFQEGSQPG